MARDLNPTKRKGSDKFLSRIQEMIDGFNKEDPPTMKKLPVEVDVPEFLGEASRRDGASELDKAVADSVLIAFYYLLRVGEYTVKGQRNNTKQTQQFKLTDVTFFKRNSAGQLRQLGRNATDKQIMAADSATLKLDNQKNGWKGVCVNQETNGDAYDCPVRALGRRFCSIRRQSSSNKTFLSAYWMNNTRCDVTDEDIRSSLKMAATLLDYPASKGIPIDRIDTHSLRSGGANALSLSGYSDRQIQKMGRWKGATFKEYIREELACFSEGMSKSMKRKFGFVNIAGGAYSDIIDVTETVMTMEYDSVAAAA